MFLRNNVLELLHRHETAFFAAKATVMTALVRCFLAKRRLAKALAKALVLSSWGRTLGPKRRLRRAQKAAATVQALARGVRGKCRFAVMKKASLVLTRHARGLVVRNHYGTPSSRTHRRWRRLGRGAICVRERESVVSPLLKSNFSPL